MSLRLPFFGLLSGRSPLRRLLEHYDKIAAGMELIEESLECYIGGGGMCREFEELGQEVNRLEEKADKIKRSIRNHLPRGLFMPVDKTVFFNYTRSQDNILDDGQDAMNWLLMRGMVIPEEFHHGLLNLVGGVTETVRLLRPALEATIELIHGDSHDRSLTKEKIRAVRKQHKKVRQVSDTTISAIYNSEMDFKDIHQLIHFAEDLFAMSHASETCADLLRAMMAR